MNDLSPDDRIAKLKGLGTSRKRVEDVRFTQGKGNYVDDIKMPGMLHGDFVRSPYAHARVKSINADAAKALPGVIAVLTAADLAPLNLHWMPTLAGDKQMVLADGKVLFQGQEVAFVVATDRYICADAIELVDVDYEELPVIVDPFKALEPGATVLREDLAGQTAGAHGPRRHPNHIFLWEAGDEAATNEAIGAAEVVAEEMIYYHRTHPCPLETCGCVASMDKVNGKLTVYGTFQAPHVVRTVASHPVGDRGAQHPRRLARYRRRLRQQGRRLSRLCLLHRRLHRHRQAGEVDRGPDGQPDGHRLCPRLLDEGQDQRHQGRQDHRPALPCDRRPRRLRRLRGPDQVSGGVLPHLHGKLRHSRGLRRRGRGLYQQGPRRGGLSLFLPRDRGRLFHRADDRGSGDRAGDGRGRPAGRRTSSARTSSPITRRLAGNTTRATTTRPGPRR